MFDRSAKSADGSYRVIAGRAVPGRAVPGRAVPGRPVGRFKYYGTRPDDPNDVIPHEHRRELRALEVFGAWTNLVDMKAGSTLDTVVTENGRGIVRHYLQDVGSTFGPGALAPRDGTVKSANFTDPAAEKLLADILIKRRGKIGRVYYSGINPLVRFELS